MPIFTFGEFRLDPASGRLTRHGEPVTLAPKAFSLLQYLAGQPGRLIPKDELLSAVWPALLPLPEGWIAEGTKGTRDACLAQIETLWADPRPVALRKVMDA